MLRLTGTEPADRLARGRIPRTRMSRWALATLVVLFLLGAGAVALARLFGKSGSRASIGVSIRQVFGDRLFEEFRHRDVLRMRWPG